VGRNTAELRRTQLTLVPRRHLAGTSWHRRVSHPQPRGGGAHSGVERCHGQGAHCSAPFLLWAASGRPTVWTSGRPPVYKEAHEESRGIFTVHSLRSFLMRSVASLLRLARDRHTHLRSCGREVDGRLAPPIKLASSFAPARMSVVRALWL